MDLPHNTMNRLLLTLLAVCCSALTVSAQDRVVLSIDSLTTSVAEGEPSCVAVRADSFPNIIAFQFSVAWDTTTLQFEEIRFGNNALNLNAGNVSYKADTLQELWTQYAAGDLVGVTLDPGTTLFEVCFSSDDITAAEGAVTFDGMLPAEFAEEGSVSSFPFRFVPGYLAFTVEPVSIFNPAVEPEWANGISIYPNPYTAGPLSITGHNLPRFDRVHVLSIDGRRVRTYVGDVRRLNLSKLPAGEYTIQIVSGADRVQRLIIKQ